MQKDAEAADAPADAEPAKKEEKKEAKKTKKKDAKKPEKKKEEEQEIPMDQAAIKAYSSVIADAAEDSEPQTPVQYHQVMAVEDDSQKKPQSEPFQVDPMGSMIQN